MLGFVKKVRNVLVKLCLYTVVQAQKIVLITQQAQTSTKATSTFHTYPNKIQELIAAKIAAMDKDRGIIQIQNEADVISVNKYHQA